MAFTRLQDGQTLTAGMINEMYAAIESLGLRSAQKNLTGSGVATLTGEVNGTNTGFTVPTNYYVPRNIYVYVNGVLQVPGDAMIETSPSTGTFALAQAPLAGDQIYVMYSTTSIESAAGSSNALNIALAVVL